MLDTASLIHYTTDDERDLASDLQIAAPVAVIPHPIDFDAFSSATGTNFRLRYMRDPNAPLIVNVGRISHKKGLDRLIAGFRAVVDVCANAELAIVGPDDEGLEQALRAQAAALGVAGSVIFTGLLADAYLYEATAAADVWALPSHTENLGLAVLEALAAARAVVITPQVNLAQPLQAAGGAIVAPAEDPAMFGREIARVLTDPALKARLGHAGRDFARQFSHQAMASRFREMYEMVIQEHRGP
jgi:glycosyltransferase involved in cell wall biosynthesis